MLRCWQARQARRSRHAEVVTSPRNIGHVPRPRALRGARGAPHGPATEQRDPRAGGARARQDTGRGSTCSRDPPSHARHARRARGGRARAPRWGLGGGIQRTAPLHPVLWAPRPSGVLGWLSCVRRASRSGVPGGLEGEIRILEAATEPPVLQGSVLEGGCAVLGLTARYAAS